MHLHCTCRLLALAVPAVCGASALFDDIVGLRHLGIDALMSPAIVKEGGKNIPAFGPLAGIKAGIALNHPLITGQPTVFPIAHDQQQVCTMLCGRKVAGVSHIIVNGQRHPCSVAHWRPARVLAAPACMRRQFSNLRASSLIDL